MQPSLQQAALACSYRPKESKTHGSRISAAGLQKHLEIPRVGKAFFPYSSCKTHSTRLRDTEGESSAEEMLRESLPHGTEVKLASCVVSPAQNKQYKVSTSWGSKALEPSLSTKVSQVCTPGVLSKHPLSSSLLLSSTVSSGPHTSSVRTLHCLSCVLCQC